MLSMGEGCESAVGIRRKCCFPQAILVHTEVSHRTLLWNTSRHAASAGLFSLPVIIFVLSVMKFSALATRTISLIRTERNGQFGGSGETRPLHASAERSVYKSVHFNYDLWTWKFRVVAYHVWCKRCCSVPKTK